jgi:tetratricopeptide (TPR) repeat protein
VAGAATWLTCRQFASPRAEPLTAEVPDPTEVRLRQEAARSPRDPAPCRDLGDHFLAARPFSALWEYQESLVRQPTDGEARLGLARAMARAGWYDLSEQTLRALATSPPSAGDASGASLRTQASRFLAIVGLRTARPQVAVAALRPITTAAPEMEVLLAHAYRAAGDFPAAEASYQRARNAEPARREPLLGSAELYLEWGRPEAAIRLLTEAGRRGPVDGQQWLWLSRAFAAKKGGLDSAALCASNAMKLDPKNAAVYYQAGLLFSRKGDHMAAANQFAQALRLDPRHAESLRDLASELRALGLSRLARGRMADFYELRGQPDRVIAALTADHASPTPDVATTLRVVRSYTQLQQPKQAAQVTEQALKAFGDDPALLSQAMLIQLLAGSRDALEALCRRVERRYPRSGEPAWFRGRMAMVEARPAEAVHQFEIAVAREPRRAMFSGALGDAYAAVPTPENLRRALPWLERAVALNPNDASTRRRLAELLMRTGQPEAARLQLLRSLDIEPSQTAALNSLLQLCGTLHHPAHAVLVAALLRSLEARERDLGRLRRQVRDHPNDAAARGALAQALAHGGEVVEARNQLERAAEAPDQPAARRALADTERLLQVLRG